MPKNREKTRGNKKKQKMLDKNNEYGISDPTPFEAVKGIMEKGRRRRDSNEE